MGQERLGPSYFFMSLMLGPLNSLLWYVPSSKYMELHFYLFLFNDTRTIRLCSGFSRLRGHKVLAGLLLLLLFNRDPYNICD